MNDWHDDMVDIEIYRGGLVFSGTGFLVGGNDVVTAAHVAQLLPGADLAIAYVGRDEFGGYDVAVPIAGSQWLGIPDPYTVDDVAVDVGLLTLASPLTSDDGFFALGSVDRFGYPGQAVTAGYPAALGGDLLQAVSLGGIGYADAPSYAGGSLDLAIYDAAALTPGTSGSPLWVHDPGADINIAFGLHAAAASEGSQRMGPTFDDAVLATLQSWALANDAGWLMAG
jgi:V8-like Glu-specific endopeptidase